MIPEWWGQTYVYKGPHLSPDWCFQAGSFLLGQEDEVWWRQVGLMNVMLQGR